MRDGLHQMKGYYRAMRKLILASGSPRRAELLKSAGFEFEVRAADIDESPLASEAASDYVIRVAREKAQSVASGITGAGAIVLAADLTVLSETIRLTLPQVALGHTVDHGESYLLPRKVGPARAMQMVLLGSSVTATDAAQFGLANFVSADDRLEERTNEIVEALLAGSPASIRGTKRILSGSLDRDRATQLAVEVEAVAACAYSEDFVSAIRTKLGGRTSAGSR